MVLHSLIQPIFFILVICFSNYCYADDPEDNMIMMPMKLPVPNNYSFASCGGKFNSMLAASLKDSMCMEPIDTIVQLVPDNPKVTFNPGSVRVKRCQGSCGKHMSCLPAYGETKLIEVAVQRVVAGKKGHKCIKVVVEQHTRCTCGCKQMASDCNNLQDYMSESCMCKCRNMDEKANCEKENNYWREDSCSCMCPKMQPCTSPKVWVPEYCSCMQP